MLALAQDWKLFKRRQ